MMSRSRRPARAPRSAWVVTIAATLAFAAAQFPAAEQDAPRPARPAAPRRLCTASGVITSGGVALPGATITVKSGDKVVAVTSSDLDGSFAVPLDPGVYSFHADLTAFAPVDRQLTIAQPPCDVVTDMSLTLGSRVPGAAPRPAPAAAAVDPA